MNNIVTMDVNSNDIPSWANKTVNAKIKKQYTFGFPRRNPVVVVTVYQNGYADLEYTQTGTFLVANPDGVSELFGVARRKWSEFKAREHRMF